MKKTKLLTTALTFAVLSASPLVFGQPEMSAKSQYPLAMEAIAEAGGGPVEATVKKINSATRDIVLEMPNGNTVETVVKPDVENLQNINPGDKVVIDHVGALLLAIERVDTALKGTAEGAEKRRSPEEAGMPGGTYTYVLEAIGTIDKVDAAARTITIDLGAGRTRVLQAGEGVDISPLKAGDTIKGIYIEQLSISVLSKNPAKPKL